MLMNSLQYVLLYYIVFWLINVCAYIAVSIGLYRWSRFVTGMEAEQLVKSSFRVTAVFACARLVAGLVGVGLYTFDHFSAISTILVLGITSLFLNTTFIMTEGWFVNKEAKAVASLPPTTQVDLRRAWETAHRLRRTLDAT